VERHDLKHFRRFAPDRCPPLSNSFRCHCGQWTHIASAESKIINRCLGRSSQQGRFRGRAIAVSGRSLLKLKTLKRLDAKRKQQIRQRSKYLPHSPYFANGRFKLAAANVTDPPNPSLVKTTRRTYTNPWNNVYDYCGKSEMDCPSQFTPWRRP